MHRCCVGIYLTDYFVTETENNVCFYIESLPEKAVCLNHRTGVRYKLAPARSRKREMQMANCVLLDEKTAKMS